MLLENVQNFVVGYVTVAPDPADSGTTLVVGAPYANYFPDPASFGNYRVVVAGRDNVPTPDNTEIILVTAKTAVGGGTWESGEDCELTITRMIEGEENREIEVGDVVYQDVTTAMLKLIAPDRSYVDISDTLVMSMTTNPGGRFKATASDPEQTGEPVAFGNESQDGDVWTLDLIIEEGVEVEFTNMTMYSLDNLVADGESVNTLVFKNDGGVAEGHLLLKED
jgi:hypothetical protein